MCATPTDDVPSDHAAALRASADYVLGSRAAAAAVERQALTEDASTATYLWLFLGAFALFVRAVPQAERVQGVQGA